MAFSSRSSRGSAPVKQAPAPKVDRRFKAGSNVDVWINSATWVPVRSSNVKAIMYDRARSRLYVQFKGGGEYFYTGVSTQRARSFFRTGSFGHEVWRLRWAGYTGYRTIMGKRGRRSYRARR